MTTRTRLPWRASRVLETLFPFPCLGCARPLSWHEDRLGLCPTCRRSLPRRPTSSCTGCGRALPAGRDPRCGECLRKPPPWRTLTYAYRYEDPLPRIVHALKFRRLDFLARDLGLALAEELRDGATEAAAVVPVPMAWPRRLLRGFNQAEVLAESLAREIDLPVRQVLRRRLRPRQARLGRRARFRNLRGTFSATDEAAGLQALLVDDVTTTGATLRAAARVLLRSGVEAVHVAVAARTPRHGEPADRDRTGTV